MYVSNRFLLFVQGRVAQASLERQNDLLTPQAQSSGATHGQDKGEAKFLRISRVELMQFLILLRTAKRQARHGLLELRLMRQMHFVDGRFARELRVGTDQLQLSGLCGCTQRLGQLPLKIRHAHEGSASQGFFDDPIGVLVKSLQ